jgi:hypothetical protein
VIAPVHHQWRSLPHWPNLVPVRGTKSAAVARYDRVLGAIPNSGVPAGIPNPSVLLSPPVAQKEALASRVEGTQATTGEVLKLEAKESAPDCSHARRASNSEPLNYRRTMRAAEEMMTELPHSPRCRGRRSAVLSFPRLVNIADGRELLLPSSQSPQDLLLVTDRRFAINNEISRSSVIDNAAARPTPRPEARAGWPDSPEAQEDETAP